MPLCRANSASALHATLRRLLSDAIKRPLCVLPPTYLHELGTDAAEGRRRKQQDAEDDARVTITFQIGQRETRMDVSCYGVDGMSPPPGTLSTLPPDMFGVPLMCVTVRRDVGTCVGASLLAWTESMSHVLAAAPLRWAVQPAGPGTLVLLAPIDEVGRAIELSHVLDIVENVERAVGD